MEMMDNRVYKDHQVDQEDQEHQVTLQFGQHNPLKQKDQIQDRIITAIKMMNQLLLLRKLCREKITLPL